MTTRRTRVVSYELAEDGTVDLPNDAIIISLDFDSEGPYGYRSRPVAVWVEVPADAS